MLLQRWVLDMSKIDGQQNWKEKIPTSKQQLFDTMTSFLYKHDQQYYNTKAFVTSFHNVANKEKKQQQENTNSTTALRIFKQGNFAIVQVAPAQDHKYLLLKQQELDVLQQQRMNNKHFTIPRMVNHIPLHSKSPTLQTANNASMIQDREILSEVAATVNRMIYYLSVSHAVQQNSGVLSEMEQFQQDCWDWERMRIVNKKASKHKSNKAIPKKLEKSIATAPSTPRSSKRKANMEDTVETVSLDYDPVFYLRYSETNIYYSCKETIYCQFLFIRRSHVYIRWQRCTWQ